MSEEKYVRITDNSLSQFKDNCTLLLFLISLFQLFHQRYNAKDRVISQLRAILIYTMTQCLSSTYFLHLSSLLDINSYQTTEGISTIKPDVQVWYVSVC